MRKAVSKKDSFVSRRRQESRSAAAVAHLVAVLHSGLLHLLPFSKTDERFAPHQCVKREDSGRQQYLCQSRAVHAVHVRPGLGFDLVPQRLVADGAVDQRLHTEQKGEAAQVVTSREKKHNNAAGGKKQLTRSFLNWQPVVSVAPLGQVVALR